MIRCVFTLDYEIYGNGKGNLRELVLEPTQRLSELFEQFHAPFVVFAEALEFARMQEVRSDPDIDAIGPQLRKLSAAGHEIALHLHPWWANARYDAGQWQLDWSERNICTLPAERIDAIVADAIAYLRGALQDPQFVPRSFRAGLWLMQPTRLMADTLVRHGVRVDSSVFKGGRTHGIGLDYRPALRNGNCWRFGKDVNRPDPNGPLLEIPIHSRMVPFWSMLRGKRLKLHGRVPRAERGSPLPRRWRDYLRLRYPQKLDFCRMTFSEMTSALCSVLREDLRDPGTLKTVVAIGHTKDLQDLESVRQLLEHLRSHTVNVSTFRHLHSELLN